MDVDQNKLSNNLWQYPLFRAFSRRRAQRFALGAEVKDAPFPYKSKRQPVSLNELEVASLCWAGYGSTGLIMGDLECSSNTFMCWSGKPIPSPCNPDPPLNCSLAASPVAAMPPRFGCEALTIAA